MNPDHPGIYTLKRKIIEHAVDFKNKASEQIIKNDLEMAVWFLNRAFELDPEDWKILMLRQDLFKNPQIDHNI